MLFAIAQAPKFKSYFENQNSLDTLCVRLMLGLINRECSKKQLNLTSAEVEPFQLG
jgi:hypothetical protein